MRLKLILSLQKLLGYCAALGDSCLLGRKVVLDPSFVVDVDFFNNETNVLTGALRVNIPERIGKLEEVRVLVEIEEKSKLGLKSL